MKRIAITVFLILMGVATVFSQPLTFDAASVKPNRSGDNGSSWHSRTGYIVMKNQTLKALVGIAYSLTDERILGGPQWAELDRFDVEARAASPAKDPELLVMLKNLLTERFQLRVHDETKSTSGFSLGLAKGGLKIHPDETEGRSGWNGGRGKMVVQRFSMVKLADTLTRILGTPVVDMTDTKGLFSFTLEWVPENERPRAGLDGVVPEAPVGPSLFTALAQDLGLKLESKKLPVKTVVIDKAEKPSEN